MNPGKRIGMILVQRGLLTADHVDRILRIQKRLHQPFGRIAHERFGVPEVEVWNAWARQVGHLCQRVDIAVERWDDHVLDLITVKEACRARMLPLRFEHGELICATTVVDLPEAMTTLEPRTKTPIRFVIAERIQLDHFIKRRYATRLADALPAQRSA